MPSLALCNTVENLRETEGLQLLIDCGAGGPDAGHGNAIQLTM